MKKVPHTPQKLPKQKYGYPRKEVRTTRFLFLCLQGEFSRTVTAIQAPVPASLAYRLLRSLALRGVGEWWGLILASPNGRGGSRSETERAFFLPPLTRFAGAPPEGEPFVNRSTIPLSVILGGGEAAVERFRVERSEQGNACVRRTRGISFEILLSCLVTKVTSCGRIASVLTRSLRRYRSSVLDRIVAAQRLTPSPKLRLRSG